MVCGAGTSDAAFSGKKASGYCAIIMTCIACFVRGSEEQR
jgi:hypothetical protein